MKQIPEGYMADHRGALIPIANIKEIDLLRDQVVKECIGKAVVVSNLLKQLKEQLFSDISAFVQLSIEKYEVKRGGVKGNLTLYSFDGKYKVQMAVHEHLTFDERLQAAKALIDDCLREWTENARPELRAIIDNAFAVDKEGKISTSRVLSLRRLDINDAKWVSAMQAISDALSIVGSKEYVRLYVRVDDTQKYEPIILDIAGV